MSLTELPERYTVCCCEGHIKSDTGVSPLPVCASKYNNAEFKSTSIVELEFESAQGESHLCATIAGLQCIAGLSCSVIRPVC